MSKHIELKWKTRKCLVQPTFFCLRKKVFKRADKMYYTTFPPLLTHIHTTYMWPQNVQCNTKVIVKLSKDIKTIPPLEKEKIYFSSSQDFPKFIHV